MFGKPLNTQGLLLGLFLPAVAPRPAAADGETPYRIQALYVKGDSAANTVDQLASKIAKLDTSLANCLRELNSAGPYPLPESFPLLDHELTFSEPQPLVGLHWEGIKRSINYLRGDGSTDGYPNLVSIVERVNYAQAAPLKPGDTPEAATERLNVNLAAAICLEERLADTAPIPEPTAAKTTPAVSASTFQLPNIPASAIFLGFFVLAGGALGFSIVGIGRALRRRKPQVASPAQTPAERTAPPPPAKAASRRPANASTNRTQICDVTDFVDTTPPSSPPRPAISPTDTLVQRLSGSRQQPAAAASSRRAESLRPAPVAAVSVRQVAERVVADTHDTTLDTPRVPQIEAEEDEAEGTYNDDEIRVATAGSGELPAEATLKDQQIADGQQRPGGPGK